jgi:hypothetical protein
VTTSPKDASIAAAEELARLVADAHARRAAGNTVDADLPRVRRLLLDIDGDVSGRAMGHFFGALSVELERRGAKLPAIDELPAGVGDLLGALGEAFEPAVATHGRPDLEAITDKLDAAFGRHLGTSPRAARRDAHEQEIRSRVAASVAESMRRNGLTPSTDFRDDSTPKRKR